jgi:hypothetical protein
MNAKQIVKKLLEQDSQNTGTMADATRGEKNPGKDFIGMFDCGGDGGIFSIVYKDGSVADIFYDSWDEKCVGWFRDVESDPNSSGVIFSDEDLTMIRHGDFQVSSELLRKLIDTYKAAYPPVNDDGDIQSGQVASAERKFNEVLSALNSPASAERKFNEVLSALNSPGQHTV